MDNCLKIAGIDQNDMPKSCDFDDEDEYRRKLLVWEYENKNRIYAFMLETGGM
jgi:hypothetical protein